MALILGVGGTQQSLTIRLYDFQGHNIYDLGLLSNTSRAEPPILFPTYSSNLVLLFGIALVSVKICKVMLY